MNCKFCGVALPESANFCAGCGRPRISEPPTPQQRRWKTVLAVLGGILFLCIAIGLSNQEPSVVKDPEDTNFGRGWPIKVEELYDSVTPASEGYDSPYKGKGVYVEGVFGGIITGA